MTAHTAYTASSHEATKNSFSRRALIGGTAALGAVGLLSACGNGSASSEKTKAAGAGANIEDLYNINAQDVNSLKKGGTLRLPAGSIGPNFNFYTQSGNTSDNVNVMSTISQAGMWNLDFDGTYKLNTDFAVSFEHSKKGDKVQVAVKLNPKAVFNDGTPITYKALQSTWNIFKSLDNGYNIVSSGIYEFVESVEKGEDDYSAIVTFSKPFYPLQSLFSEILHPALEDVELFNNGFDKPLDKYWAGPYKVQEWNTAERYLRVERNPAWWGTQPLLDTITWYEIEDSAEERASFKTGELDVVNVSTVSAYNDITSVADIEIRRGMALYAGVLQLNPRKVPLPIRQAVVAGIDRKQIQHIRFGQLGWKEPLPGSLCFLPLQNGYRNNYPSRSSIENAVKILEKAGYARAGIYTKGEETAALPITNFTTEPTVASMSNFMMEQLKRMGIDAKVENRPANEYSTALAAGDYDAVFTGYSITPTPVEAVNYLYASATEGWSTEEIRSMAAQMLGTEDTHQQLERANAIEQKHQQDVATYIPLYNGPNYLAVRKKLANYGPALFAAPYYDPNVWINVGWEKKS